MPGTSGRKVIKAILLSSGLTNKKEEGLFTVLLLFLSKGVIHENDLTIIADFG